MYEESEEFEEWERLCCDCGAAIEGCDAQGPWEAPCVCYYRDMEEYNAQDD